jgi:hypothetical protein
MRIDGEQTSLNRVQSRFWWRMKTESRPISTRSSDCRQIAFNVRANTKHSGEKILENVIQLVKVSLISFGCLTCQNRRTVAGHFSHGGSGISNLKFTNSSIDPDGVTDASMKKDDTKAW